MRIAFLRKQAQKLGLCVDSTFVFVEDTHEEVVVQRKDGKVLCLQPVILNIKAKKIYNKTSFSLSFLGNQIYTKDTKQVLDCLKNFAR